MDYLTEEELYELEHQDELDALDDIEPPNSMEYEDFDPFSFAPQNRPISKKIEKKSLSESDLNDSEDQTLALCNKSNTTTIATAGRGIILEGKTIISDTFCDQSTFNLGAVQEEKENEANYIHEENFAKGKPSAKRKLLYSSENEITKAIPVDFENDFSESLISQSEKRKVVDLSDDELDTESTAKRHCFSHAESEVTHQSYSERSSFLNDQTSCLKETLTLTCTDGRRVRFGLKEEEVDNEKALSFSQRTSSLLSTSIDKLKSQYFILEEQLLKEQEVVCVDSGPVLPETDDENKENSLWVEKYRPASYMHLLSEEGINRTLLQWLKLWDKVVFGREKKTKKKAVEPPKKPAKFQKTWGELVEDLDEHGRPYHKVAFLSGPPGLGKTTLATIIARHAGYNVVELNASDDRNPESFRVSLEAATQMKSVLHEDHKPNCLILDEIDGAPAASINVLLSFIKSVGIPKGAKRKKGDIPLLTRPLICICNDQYSAALKPLRQLALVLNFPSTEVARLAARLHEVSRKEGLSADMAALNLLCEKTANDIRSCLSTLQFIHRQKNELKVSDLEGMQIGQKDMQKSLFAVWQDIFHFKIKKSFSDTYNIVQAFGDYEKVFVGMFENYVNVKFKYRNLDVVWQGSEWICFADIIQQQIAHHQLYFLLPYLPYPAVAFHMLFATNSFPHISYPTSFYESKSKGFQLSNTLTSMIKDMVSSLKAFLNSSMLLVDMFPFMQEIIKPNLRPVNTQLYSEREKGELRRVIELMTAFKLNYHQERSQDGTYNYVLDPNIEELTRFSDIKPKKVLTYAAKQMIAREVEMEQMRKGDSSADQKAVKLVKDTKAKAPEPKVLQKKEIIVERPMLDFFGRQIIPTAKENEAAKKKISEEEDIWFHFKEGYSNAVRRPVYIKDLL